MEKGRDGSRGRLRTERDVQSEWERGRMERWRTAGSDLEEKENVFQMKSNEPIKE